MGEKSEEEFQTMVTERGLGKKILESIRIAESKKKDIKESICSLVVHWKGFEGSLDLVKKDLCEGLCELDTKEESLNSKKEWLEQRESDFALFREKKMKDLERRESLLNERLIEIDLKEKELKFSIEDYQLQEKKAHFIRNMNEKQMVELDLKEKGLENEKEILEKGLKDLELQRKVFGEEVKEFELRKNEFEFVLAEFHSKNRDMLLQKELHEEETRRLLQEKEELKQKVKQFELAKTGLEKSLEELVLEKIESFTVTQLLEIDSQDQESKWRKLNCRTEELNMRQKELEKFFRDLQLKEKLIKEDYEDLESKKKELVDSTKNLFEKDSKHLELRRKELEERIEKFECREREFELNHKKIELEKLLEKDSKDLESEWKKLEERIKNFETRLKELELREEKLESGKKLIEEDSKSIESRKKELDERIQKLELREKQLDLKEKQQFRITAAHSHLETELDCDPFSQSFSYNNTKLRSSPMAVIIANMDGEDLLYFLSIYWSEHELLRNEVKSALQISHNSPKLVLDAVENLFDFHLTDEDTKCCIFLLEQLLVLSPNITPDVKETAQNIAFNWRIKNLKASNSDSQLILAYLLLVSAYRLDSGFHRDELQKLYQMVVELKPSPLLSEALGISISKDASSAAPFQSRVETQNALSRSVSMVTAGHDGKACVSVHSEVPTFINLSAEPATLILAALICCHKSKLSENNKNLQLVARSFHCLLEHLTSVSPKIETDVKERAYKFFLDWTAKPIVGASNMWETLGRLQLVAAYQLLPLLSYDQIFCLMEVAHPVKKIASFIRMFGLVHKVPDLISKLNQKKKFLDSFAYIYEFNLTEAFPPVAILKQYVQSSKLASKEHKTTYAQVKSIDQEISALNKVIKLITQHKLESEYPPDELRSTIKDLKIHKANLRKIQMKKREMNSKIQINNNKRHRPTSDSFNNNEEAAATNPPHRACKFRRSDFSKSCSKFSSPHQIQYPIKPLSHQQQQHPGDIGGYTDLYPPTDLRTLIRNYVSHDEMLPSNHKPERVYNYIPHWKMNNKDTSKWRPRNWN